MARTPKSIPVFPSTCCGTCDYSLMDEKQNCLCFVNPPILLFVDDDNEPYWARGVPVDPHWKSCHLFKPRMHA